MYFCQTLVHKRFLQNMDERDERPDWELDKDEITWFHRVLEHPLFGRVVFVLVMSTFIFVVVGSLFVFIHHTLASAIVLALMAFAVMLVVGFIQREWISNFWRKKVKLKIYPTLFDHVTTYLKQKEIKYEKTPDEELVKFTVGTENLAWECALQHQEDNQVLLRSFTPFDVPLDRQEEVAELTNRLNEKSISGYFVFNFDDNVVECRTVLRKPTEPSRFVSEFDDLFEDHFDLFRWRINHIAEVVFEDKTAVEVLNRKN